MDDEFNQLDELDELDIDEFIESNNTHGNDTDNIIESIEESIEELIREAKQEIKDEKDIRLHKIVTDELKELDKKARDKLKLIFDGNDNMIKMFYILINKLLKNKSYKYFDYKPNKVLKGSKLTQLKKYQKHVLFNCIRKYFDMPTVDFDTDLKNKLSSSNDVQVDDSINVDEVSFEDIKKLHKCSSCGNSNVIINNQTKTCKDCGVVSNIQGLKGVDEGFSFKHDAYSRGTKDNVWSVQLSPKEYNRRKVMKYMYDYFDNCTMWIDEKVKGLISAFDKIIRKERDTSLRNFKIIALNLIYREAPYLFLNIDAKEELLLYLRLDYPKDLKLFENKCILSIAENLKFNEIIEELLMRDRFLLYNKILNAILKKISEDPNKNNYKFWRIDENPINKEQFMILLMNHFGKTKKEIEEVYNDKGIKKINQTLYTNTNNQYKTKLLKYVKNTVSK